MKFYQKKAKEFIKEAQKRLPEKYSLKRDYEIAVIDFAKFLDTKDKEGGEKKQCCAVCGIPWKDGKGFIGEHKFPCYNDRYGTNWTVDCQPQSTNKDIE